MPSSAGHEAQHHALTVTIFTAATAQQFQLCNCYLGLTAKRSRVTTTPARTLQDLDISGLFDVHHAAPLQLGIGVSIVRWIIIVRNVRIRTLRESILTRSSAGFWAQAARRLLRALARIRERALADRLDPALGNLTLSMLSASDRTLLRPLLDPVHLPLRRYLERPNKRIDFVYFPDSGFASVVAGGSAGGVEVGIIGREGTTGLAVILGADRSPHETYMQYGGTGHRISASALKGVMAQSTSLRELLLRTAYIFSIQTAQTALANGRFKLEERLSRWLLMARDRLDSDEISITQEFLALMLGVRRPGVNVAVRALEDQALIKSKRGNIVILDREGLEISAAGSYGTAEAEQRRLISSMSTA